MIQRQHRRKIALATHWVVAIVVACCAVGTSDCLAQKTIHRTFSKNTVVPANYNTATPQVAQRPGSSLYTNAAQITNKIIESLPTPTPDPRAQGQPVQAQPQQHFIPFLQPDPNAIVNVEEHEGLISLKVRDASLRQVVAMIAETQNLNIVFASPADIGITAQLDQVAWQQALDSLLTATGHTWSNNNGIIYVTSLEMVELLPPGSAGQYTRIFELDFASAVDVDLTIKGLLSPTGQSWVQESSPEDNRRTREVVVVFDFPAHLERIAQYICEADQPPRQVLIEAHILKVQLEEDCKNGVNFDVLASFRGNELNFRTVGFANPAASSAFFLEATGAALDGLVELLQTTTDAKTLASPRLLVVSGQQARIQIGEQLGYRVTTTTQTSSLESVEFLDVGVVLTVTPRITRDGRVLMRIKPEVSTGNVSPLTGLPEEETTEVETDILLTSGQGMVIGGLIQEQDDILQSKIPYLGNLPYIGVLFQKRQAIKNRSEIIVTLTPRVQPYSPIVASREAHALMKTEQPLTVGPLKRAPRPYEPRLYDALTNPRPFCVDYRYAHLNHPATDISPLLPLPPIEEDPYCLPTIGEPEYLHNPELHPLPELQDIGPGTEPTPYFEQEPIAN